MVVLRIIQSERFEIFHCEWLGQCTCFSLLTKKMNLYLMGPVLCKGFRVQRHVSSKDGYFRKLSVQWQASCAIISLVPPRPPFHFPSSPPAFRRGQSQVFFKPLQKPMGVCWNAAGGVRKKKSSKNGQECRDRILLSPSFPRI